MSIGINPIIGKTEDGDIMRVVGNELIIDEGGKTATLTLKLSIEEDK